MKIKYKYMYFLFKIRNKVICIDKGIDNDKIHFKRNWQHFLPQKAIWI